MAFYIGIDIGTTGTKTVLINENGKCIAGSTIEYPLDTPKQGWAEQDPGFWWDAAVKTIKDVLFKSNVSGKDIKGIGLSGQMHGSVFLDKNGAVIRPAILWCDQRTEEECEYITGKIGKSRLIELTCNPALTGFTAPKILWLRNNEPENYEKINKVLLPKDYIRFKLTGEFASEVSDASGTLLFDVSNRKWSKTVIEELELDFDILPECYESYEVSGRISRAVAAETGLAEGIPVVGGGGDQAAGALGNGIVEEGIISATLGTSGVVFAFSEKPERDPEGRLHTFCHAVPGKWHVMGVMLAAGGSFRWLRDTFCQEEVDSAKKQEVDPYEIMTALAEKTTAGSEGLVFLPYLSGERTPYPDPKARGAFIGLTLRHEKKHIIRSVMEGITFGMNDSLRLIRAMNIKISHIRLSGGGGKSKFWRRMQADIYNTDTASINMDEGPAFGVALLAAVGTGCFRSIEEACKNSIDVINKYKPDNKQVEIYQKYYEQYRLLYPVLKKTFSGLSEIS